MGSRGGERGHVGLPGKDAWSARVEAAREHRVPGSRLRERRVALLYDRRTSGRGHGVQAPGVQRGENQGRRRPGERPRAAPEGPGGRRAGAEDHDGRQPGNESPGRPCIVEKGRGAGHLLVRGAHRPQGLRGIRRPSQPDLHLAGHGGAGVRYPGPEGAHRAAWDRPLAA